MLEFVCSELLGSHRSQCDPRLHGGTVLHLPAICAARAIAFGVGTGRIERAHCTSVGAPLRPLRKVLDITGLVAVEPSESGASDKRLANRLQSGSI